MTGPSPWGGPPRVGLTGGIGAGKSEALAALRDAGAAVLSSDEVVHRLYERDDVRDEVVARFGDGILDASGDVDRAVLGPLAFSQDGGIAFLEGVLFPRIAAERAAWMAEEASRAEPAPLLVCEVPLLFEAGVADQFDRVVMVTASEGVRRERVAARGGAHDFDQRAARQWPEDRKVAAADEVFVNDGDLDALRSWARDLVARGGMPDDA